MLIENVRVFGPDCAFHDGQVSTLGAAFSDTSQDGVEIDGQGLMAVPGFIDIHLHGAKGADFMDATPQSLSTIARHEALRGVTAICPATMTEPAASIERALANAASFIPGNEESSIAGITLEGPFISKEKCGAQDPRHIIAPDCDLMERLIKAAKGLIRTVVIAPEAEGALPFISRFSKRLAISLGHTATDYDLALEALRAGATRLTHAYNAMPPFLSRAPGLLGAAFDTPGTFAEVIGDGLHVHPSAVRMLSRCIGPTGLIMISDSMRATGLPDGDYTLGGQKVIVKSGAARLESGTLAGSVRDLRDIFVTAVKEMGMPLELALRAVTANPARAIGLGKTIGAIAPGLLADLVLLDDDLEIRMVVLRGKVLVRKI